MKKRILALVLVVMAVMMTACGSKAYEKGTYTDDGYETAYLGFRYTTPEGFTLADEESLDSMMGVALDALGDDVTEAQKRYAEVATIYEMMVSDSTGACNLNINLEKTGYSVDKYIEAFKEQVVNLTTMDVVLADSVEEVELAGSTYKKMDAVVQSMGVTVNQEYYFRKAGDRMMSMAVTWADGFEAEKEQMMSGFSAY